MADSGTLQQIATLLGGPGVMGRKLTRPLDLVATVRQGLPYRSLETLLDTLHMSIDEFSVRLAIPRRTLARRKDQGRLDVIESERLVRLAKILARANMVLGSGEKALRWLEQANRALGGAAPLDLLDTDVGAQEVENVLGRIEHGVVS